MSTPNETPVEQAPAQPEAEKPQMMAPKSRNALLRYMTILFAVAFLVVTVSLVISMHASQNTITALNQTSASALQNAEQLQDSNRDLSDENAKLRDRVAELEDQLASAKADAETAASAQESADNTAKAYELLLQAMDAKSNGDTAACSAALAQLEPLQSYLQDSAAALYAQLAA